MNENHCEVCKLQYLKPEFKKIQIPSNLGRLYIEIIICKECESDVGHFVFASADDLEYHRDCMFSALEEMKKYRGMK